MVFGSYDRFIRLSQKSKWNLSDANHLENIKECAEFNNAPSDITLHDAILQFAHCGGAKPTYEDIEVVDIIGSSVPLVKYIY